MQRELTPKDTKEIEGSDYSGKKSSIKNKLEYKDSLIWIFNLIQNGEAVPEIGKTEDGFFVWLKIHELDRKTNKKKGVIFYSEINDDIGKFYNLFNQNGIEPEFKIVEK